MLFHLPIIGNPEVAERTMIAELEANSWYAQPSFPCVKMLKEDLTRDERLIRHIFFPKNAKLCRGWLPDGSRFLSVRRWSKSVALAPEAATGAFLNVLDEVCPAPELSIA